MFLLAVLLGYLTSLRDYDRVKKILDESFSQFAYIRNLNVFMVFLFIFLNNAIKGFFVLIGGVLFGVAPLLFIFLNGQLVGFVLGAAQFRGIGIGRVMAGIAPHGIIEIPAIILSSGYGLWLGYKFYRFVWKREPFKVYFSYALKKYIYVILPLFFVAAIIEAFITPLVLNFFHN